ncbi:MAG TPA: BON domain-containing protein [Pyrinomonadaceae bacterium]|nr:BON domain-containing protein [Pyrinomonadaceae bacterium]
MQVKSAKNKFLVAGIASLLVVGAASCKGSAGNTNTNNSNTATVMTPTPAAAPSIAPDTALRNTVEANLTKYNVTGVTVEVSGGEVTLKGDIPRAKLQDAMKAANEASPRKVNNQMNIK